MVICIVVPGIHIVLLLTKFQVLVLLIKLLHII
jgi:hypothetical protein